MSPPLFVSTMRPRTQSHRPYRSWKRVQRHAASWLQLVRWWSTPLGAVGGRAELCQSSRCRTSRPASAKYSRLAKIQRWTTPGYQWWVIVKGISSCETKMARRSLSHFTQ